MWQQDIQPQFSFERAAQVMGVHRARELWDGYRFMELRKAQEADALEQAMAGKAEKRGYIVNEELGDAAPEWRMAPWSFVRLWRASMNEKGCHGGEFLDDSHYMRWFLKKNPALRIMARSGNIVSGWTAAVEDRHHLIHFERARKQGEVQRAFELQQRGGLIAA